MSRHDTPWPAGTPCWAALQTSDTGTARDFYTAVLGWRHELAGPAAADYTIAMVDGAAAAAVGPAGPAAAPDQPSAWCLYLATDDAAATAAAVTQPGGQVVADPREVPTQGVILELDDPAGARLGAWQAGGHIGAQVVDEPGAMCWRDLRSTDPAASREFLTVVFGLTHQRLPFGDMDYQTLHLADGGDPVGGAGELFDSPRAQWLISFAVADIDVAVGLARDHGARSVGEVDDTPFGRKSDVVDAVGAPLVLIQLPG